MYSFIQPSIFPSLVYYLSIYQSTINHLPIPVHPSIYSPINLTIIHASSVLYPFTHSSIPQSVHPSIYQSIIQPSPVIYLLTNLLINPFMHPFNIYIHVSSHPSFHKFTHPPILYPHTKLPIHPHIHSLFFHLSSYLLTLPPIHLFSIFYTHLSIHPSHRYELQSIIHAHISVLYNEHKAES